MTSAESERAAVVAWLREQSVKFGEKGEAAVGKNLERLARDLFAGKISLSRAADAIERGDHQIGLVTDEPEHRLSGELKQIAAADHGAGSRSSDGSGTSRDHLKGQSGDMDRD